MSDPNDTPVPNFDEIKQALEFDPFTPPAREGSGEQGSTEAPADSTPQAQPASTEGQAPQPTPSDAPPSPGGSQTSEEDLRKLIADQRALIDRLQQPQPPTPSAKPEGEAEEFKPVYTADLPRELFQALGSDDENIRYRAMDGLVKGLMNTLAYDTQRYVKSQIALAVEQVTGSIPAKVQEVSSADSIKRDFFSAFPALANPVLGAIVQGRLSAWAQAEAQRNGGRFSWNEDFRNRAGQALHAELGIPLPGGGGTPAAPPPPAQPQRAAPQPRRPSFSSGGNSGSSPNGPSDNPFADILF